MAPVLDLLQILNRTGGKSLPIFLEGSGEPKDDWYYRQWFSVSEPALLFLSVGSCQQVQEEVIYWRSSLSPNVLPVYGIIDRDFTPDSDLDMGFPNGIIRTRRYELENHLLDPDCWAKVLEFRFRQYPSQLRQEWTGPIEMTQRIHDAYRECLKCAAYNRVIRYGNEHYSSQASQTGENERTYPRDVDFFRNLDPAMQLENWQRLLSARENFREMFSDYLLELENASIEVWEQHVKGKYVLKTLHRKIPSPRGHAQWKQDALLNQYLDRCPNPPADLQTLATRILADARQSGWSG